MGRSRSGSGSGRSKANSGSSSRSGTAQPANPITNEEDVEPLLFEASSGPNGSVIRGSPIYSVRDAAQIRRAGMNIVVCGSSEVRNQELAARIEQESIAGEAGRTILPCRPHRQAGPEALPHYHESPRYRTGHTFWETDERKAREA